MKELEALGGVMVKEGKPMNIFTKIQRIKEELLKENLKKSGFNKFSNFSYYELADITPAIVKLCNKYKVMTQTTFARDYATLFIYNAEDPKDYLVYQSPMEELELKGCNKIQALGGTETYQRRYLYMMAFDIIESDMFDATSGMTDEDRAKAYVFGAGKCKGKTIEEVYKEDPKYLQWCLDNGKNEEVKGYIETLTDLKRTYVPENEEEQQKRLKLINQIVEEHGQKDLEQLKEDYHVKEIWQLTTEEMEAIVNE